MQIKFATAATIACGLFACATSHAQEAAPATQYSVGLKAWDASWSSYLPATAAGVNASGKPVTATSVDSVDGDRRTNFIPQIAVRRGNYFVSGSYGKYDADFHVGASTVATGPATTLITSRTDHFMRKESDLTAGYFITPEVALTIGFKYAKEYRDISLGIAPQATPLLDDTVAGVVAGFVGSFPIKGALRLYTQAAYGPGRYKSTFADSAMPSVSGNATYLIAEFGVAYPLYPAHDGFPALNGALGYRTQTFKSTSNDTSFNESRKLRDVRDGVVLSVTATF